MRVDRIGSKGLPVSQESGAAETTLTKKGNKLTLHAGKEDEVHISKSQNSLKIQVNQEQVFTLTPEEFKNLKITGHAENVKLDPEVSLSSFGLPEDSRLAVSPKEGQQNVAPKEGRGRKDERALTGQVTREILASELKNFLAEQGEPSVSDKVPQNPSSIEDISVNLNTLRGPEAGTGQQGSTFKPQGASKKSGQLPVASGRKEETSLTATIKKKDLSSELRELLPDDVSAERSAMEPGEEKLKAGGETVHSGNHQAPLLAGMESHPAVSEGEMPGGLKGEEHLAGLRTQGQIPSAMKAEGKPAGLKAEGEQAELRAGAQLPAGLKAELPQPSPAKTELSRFMEENTLSPEQKTQLFESLSAETGFSVFEERGIQRLLASVSDGVESHALLSDRAGFGIAHALKDPEMKVSWDRIVSALGRPELALNPEEGMKTSGLFQLPPETLQRLAPGCIPLFLSREKSIQPDAHPLELLDPPAFCLLAVENRIRELDGKPLVHAADLRKNVLEILTDGSLSGEQRFVRMEGLKNGAGLSDFQMHEMITRPLGNFLQTAIEGAHQERNSVVQTMQSRVQEATESFGAESVAVEIAKAEHEEILGGIDSRAQRLENFHSIAAESFSGPLDPLVKTDRLFEGIMTAFFPAIQTVQPEVNKILAGAIGFQSGKLQSALAQLERSGIPALKSFVQNGSLFTQAVRNGTFPALLVQLGSHPDFARNNLSFPEFTATAKFLAQLSTGTYARQMQSAMEAMIEHSIPPPVREPLSRIQQWKSEIASPLDYPARQRLVNEGEALQRELVGTLQSTLPAISRGVAESFEDPRFSAAMETFKNATDVMTAFRRGRMEQVLDSLNRRVAGNAALKQIIEHALHITNSGTPFFGGLLNREWERPIFTALKKSSGNKELQEVVGIFTDTLNLFLPLTSVENSSPFLEYQKQLGYLKDEELMNEWLHQYRSGFNIPNS